MLNTLGPVPFTPLLSAIITPGPQQIDFHCRPIAIVCQAGAGYYATNKLGQRFCLLSVETMETRGTDYFLP